MGRISNTIKYPSDDSISKDDFLIGTDVDNNNKTKNYPIGNLIAFFKENITNSFSKDEEVIGKFINGEIIYRRAIDLNNLPEDIDYIFFGDSDHILQGDGVADINLIIDSNIITQEKVSQFVYNYNNTLNDVNVYYIPIDNHIVLNTEKTGLPDLTIQNNFDTFVLVITYTKNL